MGTSLDSHTILVKNGESTVGIIPRAAIHLFEGIEQRKKVAREQGSMEPSFEVCVQFIEVYIYIYIMVVVVA
jgi:hypothetical protein